MSGLFDSLSAASSALSAQRAGLDVVGQNLANINTVGYTRRTLDLAEVPPSDATSSGRGVQVQQIRALRDAFVEARIRREHQSAMADSAVVSGLSDVQAAVGLPGASLDGQLTAFFDAFSTFANDTTSTPARDGVVRQGQLLAQSFNDLAGRLVASQRNADTSIGAGVDQINQLAGQVATLNQQIMSGGPGVEALRDQRDVAVGQLADLAGVNVMARDDGGVDVTIGQGRALVVGGHAFQLDAAASGASGFLALSVGGADITSEISGGTIGGLLAVRDSLIPGYQNRLDQLASDMATQVNALHSAGFDGNGAPAGAFFVPPASVAGAAAAMAVDPGVAADSRLVAGSGTGASGDNQTARAIAALRDARVMSGGTATAADAWGQFAYHVGLDVAAAKSAGQTQNQIVQQLQALRDQTSGVSMDEEAANLMRYQRAYEASARYFTTIVSTIDTLMQMVVVP